MLSSPRYQEAEIVRVTLVVLFLSLVIVYVAYFQINQDQYFVEQTPQELPGGEIAQENLSTWTLSPLSDINLLPSTFSSVSDNADTAESDIIQEALSGGLWTFTETTLPTISPVSFLGTGATAETESEDVAEEVVSEKPEKIILSGTQEYFWSVDAADVLWLDYTYALSDWEIIYAYLGTGDYDLKPIARNLGWNVVEIVAEIDILKNGLFWEKITFVNIPGVTYTTIPVEERQKVFVVVWFGDDRRLVQVDFASYHRLKPTIKQRFASYY